MINLGVLIKNFKIFRGCLTHPLVSFIILLLIFIYINLFIADIFLLHIQVCFLNLARAGGWIEWLMEVGLMVVLYID